MSSSDHVGPERLRRFHALQAVVGGAGVVAHERQHHGQAVRPVPVVVHDQDAALRGRTLRRRRRDGCSRGRHATSDRQADDERAALAQPRRCGPRRVPPCISTSRLAPGSGRCPARPATAPAIRSTWENISKMRGSVSAGMPIPVSSHRHDRLAPLPLGGQPDAAARLGVLGAVVQQVREHLGQPGQVGVQVDRRRAAA